MLKAEWILGLFFFLQDRLMIQVILNLFSFFFNLRGFIFQRAWLHQAPQPDQ